MWGVWLCAADRKMLSVVGKITKVNRTIGPLRILMFGISPSPEQSVLLVPYLKVIVGFVPIEEVALTVFFLKKRFYS